MFRLNRKGQNTAEYAVLLAIVIGAVVAMQTYVKRSLQGGVKYAVDNFKKNDTATGQYEPYYLETDFNVTQKAYTDTTEQKVNGEIIRTFGATGEHATERAGTQKIKTDGAD